MQGKCTRWFGRTLLGLAAMAFLPAVAQDTLSSRPIRIVVPFPPGGAADSVSRIVADKLAAQLGQPVIVENKAGASGNIGAEMVALARPDGHTLLSSPPPPFVINQSLFAHLSFDPAKFVPITVLAGAPNVLVAHPGLGVGNAAELIALAKREPGRLNYASTGSGGTPHITSEWFKAAAGVQITHIPYKGAQAYPAVLAGEAHVMFMTLGDALPLIRSGRLKALAVCSENPLTTLPGVRPLNETIPGFVSSTWFAVAAPPATPTALAERLSAAIVDVLRLPESRKRLAEMNLDPVGTTPAETVAFFRVEAERWGKVIRAADIKPD